MVGLVGCPRADLGKGAEGGMGAVRGCEDKCSAICCSAMRRVPMRARRCSSRKRVTASGEMYFLHSRKPRARMGMV